MRTIVHHFVDPTDTIRGIESNGELGIRIETDPARVASTEFTMFFGVADSATEAARQLDAFIEQLIDLRARAYRRAAAEGAPRPLRSFARLRAEALADADDASHVDGLTGRERARLNDPDDEPMQTIALGNDPDSSPTYRSDIRDAGRGDQLRG